MIRRQFAILCSTAVLWTCCYAGTSAQETLAAKPTIQEKVVGMPLGAVVVVKTVDKRTVTGRLGPLTEHSFDLQYAKGGTLTTETLAFADVKSVKLKGKGMSTGAKIAIGAAIGAAAVIGVALAVAAAYGWD